jgi:endonuclease/exonuclease/phosphatase family metal-dependent hydrolase
MTAHAPAQPAPRDPRHLRLLSYNIQAGQSVKRYREYVTRGWQNVLPHPSKRRNLVEVATLVAGYDLVALQEADAGSLRSGFQNQVQWLAEKAGFPFWSHQANRRVARLSESSNGLLSRFEPSAMIDHRLPGAIPGRGALEAVYGNGASSLRVIVAHLALTPRARRTQLAYLAEIIGDHAHVVLMGDFNCTIDGGELRPLFAKTALLPPALAPSTFPSWRPKRAIDHILVAGQLKPLALEVPLVHASDHLPIALTVELPHSLKFQ